MRPGSILCIATIYLITYIVIDTVLLSEDDVMRNDSVIFQRNVQGQNNIPTPRIRIPTSIVQKQYINEGWHILCVNYMTICSTQQGEEFQL